MSSRRLSSRLLLAAVLVLAGAASALAVRRTEDPLGLVPDGAASVAVLRWNDLRSSPLAAQIFAQMDDVSTDGDAARFLRDTGLTPKDDIDTMVLAMTHGGGTSDDVLVVFEGRFDPVRIGNALKGRGATLQKSANGAGAYYRLAADSADHGRNGAVAVVNAGLVLAGSEGAVTDALARKESGGAGGLMAGQGLGKHLSRIDRGASAWALVDLTRFPATQNREAHVNVQVEGDGQPSRAIVGAMKSVSLLALQATVHGDSVDVSAFGLSSDAESRGLIEDSLKGVLAMWRLAIQDKNPEMVSVLRRFRIESESDGVSISGTLPGSFLRSLATHHEASAR
jgi:hypothetical protein